MRREFDAILAASGIAGYGPAPALTPRVRYWARLVRAGRMTPAEFEERVAAARRELGFDG
ncbi:hypothetical protein [Catellatospora sp. NPDC049609]|uniref:hypothetical protein n=1 Tax=Catellatospora sp. NPDC049609 TaxID=3155505 RepID=UPI00343F4CFA